MEKLRVLELFGGIGACSKALERLGIDYEIADYVEIDKYAVASFNAIHNTNFEPQDITTWDKDIEVDLIMHGSPCQDFSLAGKQAGGDEGTGTRSSLMYETIRIVEKLKPKYVIWENVKNLLSKKHRHNFDAYLETMGKLGYKNYYQVLNAKDYGIPQNRERVFTVSILSNENYEFPEKQELKILPIDLIEKNADIKYDLTEKNIKHYQRDFGSKGKELDLLEPIPTLTASMGTGGGNIPYFTFPPKQELKLKLKDMLEDEVDEKYYLSDEIIKKIKYKFDDENVLLGGLQEHQSVKKDGICTTLTSSMGTGGGYVPIVSRKYGVFDDEKSKHQAGSVYDENGLSPTLDTMQGGWRQPCIEIKNATKQGYLEATDGDGCYISNIDKKRGTVQKGMIQTLSTCPQNDLGVVMLKRGYPVEVKPEKDNVDDVDIIGNYSKSEYGATPIVNKNGLVPTVRENHGQVTAITTTQKDSLVCEKNE